MEDQMILVILISTAPCVFIMRYLFRLIDLAELRIRDLELRVDRAEHIIDSPTFPRSHANARSRAERRN